MSDQDHEDRVKKSIKAAIGRFFEFDRDDNGARQLVLKCSWLQIYQMAR